MMVRYVQDPTHTASISEGSAQIGVRRKERLGFVLEDQAGPHIGHLQRVLQGVFGLGGQGLSASIAKAKRAPTDRTRDDYFAVEIDDHAGVRFRNALSDRSNRRRRVERDPHVCRSTDTG